MKRLRVMAMVIGFLVAAMQPVAAADLESLKAAVKDEKRIIQDFPVERHIDAMAAHQMAVDKKTPIVDIRTIQEYQLIGHIADSYSIPFAFWGKWDEQKKSFGWEPNPDFVKLFEGVFPDKNAPYVIMCRSGHRSTKAVKTLAAAGYTNLYQMWDGFEGMPVKDKSSPDYGKKVVDGWRFKGLPYTYDMDPRLVVMK